MHWLKWFSTLSIGFRGDVLKLLHGKLATPTGGHVFDGPDFLAII